MTTTAEQALIVTHLERQIGHATGQVPEVQFHCPFCIERRGNQSVKRTLRVNVEKGKAICFRCEAAFASLETFLKGLNGGKLSPEDMDLIESRGPTEYIEKLRSSVLLTLYERKDLNKVMKLKPMPLPPCAPVWEDHGILHKRAQQYMHRRGVDPREGERFDVRFCASDEDFGGRLIFPVHQGGRIVYWTNRSIRKSDPLKSKNPTNREGYFTKNDCLLNFDYVVGAPVVNLCEGPFDMFAFNNPVAIMGKSLSTEQLTLLRALEQQGMIELVLSLDAEVDPLPYYETLTAALTCRVTYLPIDHGDPFDRRDEMDALMELRHEPTIADSIPRRGKKERRFRSRDRDEPLVGAVERILRKKPHDPKKQD